MTPDIGLILGIDGIATGSIYVLVGLGLVLIFSVTRVVFVPFGDIVAFAALTLASLQLNRLPGTVYLIATLAVVACLVEIVHYARRGQASRIPRGLVGYGVLPLIPAAIAWFTAGISLPSWIQIPLAIALVVPIGPLIERIALRPIADASVLLLLIVSVALTFGLSGLGLLFFGAEGFRTRPLTNEVIRFGSVIVTSQTILMVAAAGVFCLMLFLFFEHHADRQGAARHRHQPRRRAHRRNPAGAYRHAGVSARLAAWRDLRNSDQSGHDAVLRFRIHHRTEGVRRRDHRRPRQLSGHCDRRAAGRHPRKLRLVLEQLVQGSRWCSAC